MKFYLRIIWTNFWLSFKEGFTNPLSALLFISGKLLRFVFFLLFFFFIFKKVKLIAGYTFNDLLFYYLVFVLVDSISQFLGRGAYFFDSLVINGNLDKTFLYPVNDIFINLFSYLDPLDLITIPFFLTYFLYFIHHSYYWPSLSRLLAFSLSFLLSIAATLAIYLLSMALGLTTPLTGELLWIWRNTSKLGRLPVNIYPRFISYLLFSLLPVGIIINGPVLIWQARIGWWEWFLFTIFEVSFILIAISSWYQALKHYQSASS